MKANEIIVLDTKANVVVAKFNDFEKARTFVIRASLHNPGIKFIVAEVRMVVEHKPKRQREAEDV